MPWVLPVLSLASQSAQADRNHVHEHYQPQIPDQNQRNRRVLEVAHAQPEFQPKTAGCDKSDNNSCTNDHLPTVQQECEKFRKRLWQFNQALSSMAAPA